MSKASDEYTATFNQLRPREVTGRRSGRLALTIVTADGDRCTLDAAARRVTIGTHADATVVVSDGAVSKVHCELRIENNDRIVLRDLGSKNGTWIGAVGVCEVILPVGGSFRIGDTTVTLRNVDAVDVPMSISGRFGDLRGSCSRMGELFALLERVATFQIDALITGETGTGKDLIAREIHRASERRDGPFVVVDCTSLNEGIAESVLFGHARGSFTGAVADRGGLIEEADGGFLFLDELGELPLSLQPKLLRALEARQVRRVGETAFRSFDVRVIAATNRDLLGMVGDGTFREDLYFRVAQALVEVPPLRDRGRGDITVLADLFLAQLAERDHRALRFENAAYDVLAALPWPGNVRQLKNAVHYAVMVAADDEVKAANVPTFAASRIPRQDDPASRPLVERLAQALRGTYDHARTVFKETYVDLLLQRADGNQSEAARLAGMSRSTLRDMLKKDA